VEPRIQYAQSEDGTSIAYWTLGEGESDPLVFMPPPYSHSQLEWQIDESRHFWEQLAAPRKLIRYDMRGSGLSDRDASDFSMEAQIADLNAIVERAGIEKFALFGSVRLGPVAVTYAARRPERVSRLILWCTAPRPPLRGDDDRFATIRTLRDQDWELYTDTVAHTVFGWAAGESAEQFAKVMRESMTWDVAKASSDQANTWDASDLVPMVKAPTMLMQRREPAFPPIQVSREVTARFPDASLVLLEGQSIFPYIDDVDSVLDAINDFLGDGPAVRREAAEPSPGAFRTVFFTDVEGSTALTDRLGDDRARELLREHERITREALKAHGGSEVKTMGDGFMASFSSATKALDCAMALQKSFADHNESADEPVNIRIGLNAGEPIAEDDPGGRGDLFGTAVNMAARIAAKAEGGEILVSNVVRELVAGKQFMFNDRGETELRGFEEAVRLFEVSWAEGD